MALHQLMTDDRLEMLKWVSKRNMHVPISDLAYMLGLNENVLDQGELETGDKPRGLTD